MSENQIVDSSFTAIMDEEMHAALDINTPELRQYHCDHK